ATLTVVIGLSEGTSGSGRPRGSRHSKGVSGGGGGMERAQAGAESARPTTAPFHQDMERNYQRGPWLMPIAIVSLAISPRSFSQVSSPDTTAGSTPAGLVFLSAIHFCMAAISVSACLRSAARI